MLLKHNTKIKLLKESLEKFDEKKTVNEIYHCGTSINYAGSRTFGINKLEDEVVIENLIKKISALTH